VRVASDHFLPWRLDGSEGHANTIVVSDKGAQYTVKVDGVADKSGNAVVSHNWSFTTR
jgi:hypothetical protein